MNKYKALTRKMLMEEYRIQDIFYNSPTKEWVVLRSAGESSGYQVPTAVKARPNGKSYALALSQNGKTVYLDLLRAVYVWFFEDLTENDAIILIDGNRENIAITNLRKVSREDVKFYDARSKEEATADGYVNMNRLKEIGVGYVAVRRKRKPKPRRNRK